jgi:hypothetical protein
MKDPGSGCAIRIRTQESLFADPFGFETLIHGVQEAYSFASVKKYNLK